MIENKQQHSGKENIITHGTIHGHIHTFDGSHRHIHGHIHKHHHKLPANIDATILKALQRGQDLDGQPKKIKSVEPQTLDQQHIGDNLGSQQQSLSSSDPSQALDAFGAIGNEKQAELTSCQIQQIIDQCCLNSLDNCFECNEGEQQGVSIDQDEELFGKLCDSCDELSSDIECCDDDDCGETPISSECINESTIHEELKPPGLKTHLQSLLEFDKEAANQYIYNPMLQADDKCFEFCDLDELDRRLKNMHGNFNFNSNSIHSPSSSLENVPIKTEEILTDMPESLLAIRPSPSQKISNLRDSKSLHSHIHSHDAVHNCTAADLVSSNLDFEDGAATKRRKLSRKKVEQFKYNWIDLEGNDLPKIDEPSAFWDATKPKDHIHCFWENCPNSSVKIGNNRELQEHVLKEHIATKSSSSIDIDACLKSLSSDTDMKAILTQEFSQQEQLLQREDYECHWGDCGFKSSDLLKFIDHFPVDHGVKEEQKTQEHTEKKELCNHPYHHHLHHHESHHHHRRSSKEDEFDEEADGTCRWEEDGDGVICGKKFDTTQSLTDHLIEDHIGAGKQEYVCHWQNCSRNRRKFNQKQKITRHLHVHTKHRPYECKICGKRFSIDLMLEQHMRIHTGEKPFQCSVCAKWFKTSSSLSIHMRIHSGVKPLVCNYPGCGKRFNESSNLTKHYKIHQRSFKCCHCIKTFNTEKQLMSHLKLYHGLQKIEDYETLKSEHNGFTNDDCLEVKNLPTLEA